MKTKLRENNLKIKIAGSDIDSVEISNPNDRKYDINVTFEIQGIPQFSNDEGKGDSMFTQHGEWSGSNIMKNLHVIKIDSLKIYIK